MDFDRLRFVSERADNSETLISVAIPEKPGSFYRFYELIYPRNVTEFSYRIAAPVSMISIRDDPGGRRWQSNAHIYMSFQACSAAEDTLSDTLTREQ